MKHILLLLATLLLNPIQAQSADGGTPTVRVFIFAGQSNMEGADSKVKDIKRFPPFAGLDMPQDKVLFSYNIGREEKQTSNGWVPLQPVGDLVGPELSFARRVSLETGAPVAIIKCAAGGTTLGGDWNPDEPSGFKLYPLALKLVQSSLAELDRKKTPYRIEGFMWHQGENDMFDGKFKPAYGNNLKNFLASWRHDLKTPNLKFYIGELCTKTIRGMDNREQAPTDDGDLKRIDVTMNLAAIAAADPAFIHLKAFDLPPQEEKLVITAAGVVQLGEILAKSAIQSR